MHGTEAPVISLGSEGLYWLVHGREAPTFLELDLWTPDVTMSLGFDDGRWKCDVDFADKGFICRVLDALSLLMQTSVTSKSS